jgi:pyruvate,orthophosphate dikinase
MQDLEFTIQEGRLWMLQTRNGKRTGAAMVRIAMEMLRQGMIDEKTALLRVVARPAERPAAPDLRPQGAQGRPW